MPEFKDGNIKTVFDLLSNEDKKACKNDLILFGKYFVKTIKHINGSYSVQRVAPEDVVLENVE